MKFPRPIALVALVFLLLAVFPISLCRADGYPHFNFAVPEPQQKFAGKAAVFKIELWSNTGGATVPDKLELAFEWAGPVPQLQAQWQSKQVLADPQVARQDLLSGFLIPLDKFPESGLWRVRARWAANGATWKPWVEFFVQKPLAIFPGQLKGEFTPLGPVPKIASPVANATLTEGDTLVVSADISGIASPPPVIELLMEKGGNGPVPNWVKSQWNFTGDTQGFVSGRLLAATGMVLGHWRVKLRFAPDGLWSQWTQFKVVQNYDPNKLPLILQPADSEKINGDLQVRISPNQISQQVNVALNWQWRKPADPTWRKAYLAVVFLQPNEKSADGTYSFTIPYATLAPGVWMLEAQSQAYWTNGSGGHEPTGKSGWANRLFVVEGLTEPVILAPTAGATVTDAIPVKIAESKYPLAKVLLEFQRFDEGVWKVTGPWEEFWTFASTELVKGTTIPMSKMGNLGGKWRVRASYKFASNIQAGASPWVEFTVPLLSSPPIQPKLPGK